MDISWWFHFAGIAIAGSTFYYAFSRREQNPADLFPGHWKRGIKGLIVHEQIPWIFKLTPTKMYIVRLKAAL